jgi:hypothetical protein
MNIIAHRGEWSCESEKNSRKSFIKAIENGFGIETDIRDYRGELVISHDMPQEKNISLEDFFELYNKLSVSRNSQVLALNIKSDGISEHLNELIKKHNIQNYFVFDMSIPDAMSYIKDGIKVYSRMSELEGESGLHFMANGIWLDQFYGVWYTPKYLNLLIERYSQICIVSSELHGFSEFECWEVLAKLSKEDRSDITLCTDYPKIAQEFFNGK